MSKSKHTPGPWKLTTPKTYRWQHIIKGQNNGYLAFVNHGDNKHSETETIKEAYANACLIAAAPEMLEALKTLIEYLDAADTPENAIQRDLFDSTFALITKAEGRDK